MSSPQQAPAQQPPDAQASQAGLAVALGLALAALWPNLDLLNLRRDLPAFKAAVALQVQRYAAASATLAARQYVRERRAAGVLGGFSPRPAVPPPVEQVAQSVDFALQPLWDSAVALDALDAAPEETQKVAGSAIADAKARLAASTEKMVLDSGWDTLTTNVLYDRRAKGYARIPEPGCCYFCGLLASRGMVYKEHSFDVSKAKFKPNKDFPDADRSHDFCRCHLAPVWNAYEPSAEVQGWQKLYEDTAKKIGYGTGGRVTADDMRVAFRQAFEGRPVDLDRSRKMRGKRTGKPTANGTTSSVRNTQDEARTELAALENNFPRLSTDQQREWTQKRMDALRSQLDPQ